MTRFTNVILVTLSILALGSALGVTAEFHPDKDPLGDSVHLLDGDCRAGSFDLDGYQGYYSNFWGAADAYAALIRPGDGSCACTEGVTVQDVHAIFRVNMSTVFVVQAEVWSAQDLGGGCLAPLAPLAASAPIQYSDFPGTGNVNMEIPLGGPCMDPADDYFVVVRFLPGTVGALIGVPVDSSPDACTTWVDRTGLAGWHDPVMEYDWVGNPYVYADLNCCADPIANESTSWGGLKGLFR